MIRIILFLCVFVTSLNGEWKDLKKELRDVLKNAYPYEAQKKLEECSKYDDVGAAAFLIALVKSKRTETTHRMTACRVLSGYKSDEVRKLLAKESKSSRASIHVLQVLTTQKDTYCLEVCEEIIMRSNDEKFLTNAIRTYGHYTEHKLPVLKKLLTKLEPRTSTSV